MREAPRGGRRLLRRANACHRPARCRCRRWTRCCPAARGRRPSARVLHRAAETSSRPQRRLPHRLSRPRRRRPTPSHRGRRRTPAWARSECRCRRGHRWAPTNPQSVTQRRADSPGRPPGVMTGGRHAAGLWWRHRRGRRKLYVAQSIRSRDPRMPSSTPRRPTSCRPVRRLRTRRRPRRREPHRCPP